MLSAENLKQPVSLRNDREQRAEGRQLHICKAIDRAKVKFRLSNARAATQALSADLCSHLHGTDMSSLPCSSCATGPIYHEQDP